MYGSFRQLQQLHQLHEPNLLPTCNLQQLQRTKSQLLKTTLLYLKLKIYKIEQFVVPLLPAYYFNTQALIAL